MYKRTLIVLLLFLFFPVFQPVLLSDEVRISFDNSQGMSYNSTNLEFKNGSLKLSPMTWFWTNTPGRITNSSLGLFLFQDSENNLLYSAQYMGPGGTTYRSSGPGNSWTKVIDLVCNRMIEASDHNLYATTSYGSGVVKSIDHGLTWNNQISFGWFGGGICEDSSHTIYASLIKNGGMGGWTTNYLIKSPDYGATWTNIYRNGVTSAITSGIIFSWLYALSNDHLMAAIPSGYGNIYTGVYISSNHGYDWNLISTFSNIIIQNILHAKDNSYYLYGDGTGIWKSADECQTFVMISTQKCNGLVEADSGVFYATSPTKLLRSFDQGLTWQGLPDMVRDTTNFNNFIYGALIQAADRQIYSAGAIGAYNGGYVFRSGYVASNSCLVSLTAPRSVKQWLSSSRSEVLNAGTTLYEFASSSDGGSTWSTWSPLSDANLQAVKCYGNGQDLLKLRVTLYSANRDSTPEISGVAIQYESDVKNSLDNAVLAPNPFNPDSSRGSVNFYNLTPDAEIRIYTVTGRSVAKLKSTEINKLSWDTRDSHGKPLPPGAYTCFITDPQGHKKSLQLVVKR